MGCLFLIFEQLIVSLTKNVLEWSPNLCTVFSGHLNQLTTLSLDWPNLSWIETLTFLTAVDMVVDIAVGQLSVKVALHILVLVSFVHGIAFVHASQT
ncbi:hypothetical protein CFN79_05535 [Chromobacterium vaccinii]|nr:hypothetical protein CFN79_05535 [Chromobacterium vaccinii]